MFGAVKTTGWSVLLDMCLGLEYGLVWQRLQAASKAGEAGGGGVLCHTARQLPRVAPDAALQALGLGVQRVARQLLQEPGPWSTSPSSRALAPCPSRQLQGTVAKTPGGKYKCGQQAGSGLRAIVWGPRL